MSRGEEKSFPIATGSCYRLCDGRIIRITGGHSAGFLSEGSKWDETVYCDVYDPDRGWVALVTEVPTIEIREPCFDPTSPWKD